MTFIYSIDEWKLGSESEETSIVVRNIDVNIGKQSVQFEIPKKVISSEQTLLNQIRKSFKGLKSFADLQKTKKS